MDSILERPSISLSQKNMEAYFASHDVQYVAEDGVFTHMSSGERYEGREAVRQMLNYIYHVAFDARAEITNKVITENKALLEARLIGRHIGEFAGLQPTNKEVDVPFCVSYDLENGLVKNARVYMMNDVLMSQLKG
jgi:hypothetical protein